MDVRMNQSWQVALDEVADWLAHNTPWRMGSCDSSIETCDVEIVAKLVPASGKALWPDGPAVAHLLICNGPVSQNGRDRLLARYTSLPQPRYTVVFGTQAIGHAEFELCAEIVTHVREVLPVDVYVLSFPPQPDSLLSGIQRLVLPILLEHKKDRRASLLETLSAEVLHRHLSQVDAPPTQEEMMRDRHLADRPPF